MESIVKKEPSWKKVCWLPWQGFFFFFLPNTGSGFGFGRVCHLRISVKRPFEQNFMGQKFSELKKRLKRIGFFFFFVSIQKLIKLYFYRIFSSTIMLQKGLVLVITCLVVLAHVDAVCRVVWACLLLVSQLLPVDESLMEGIELGSFKVADYFSQCKC